jgi:hypothetical protein
MTDHIRVSERMADKAADKIDAIPDEATRVALDYAIAAVISLTNEVVRLKQERA